MQNNNSNNDREFLGVTQNECTLQGKVIGDPVIYSDNYAFLTLRTTISEQDSNGQWIDTPQDIPVITMDTSKVTVIKNYIQDGRELLLYTYYKAWMNQGQPQHAFVIKKIVFGRKKYEPKGQGFSAPSLPTA
jgi:hypothetical protein